LADLGFFRILCEGGPELVTQLANLDLLDEIDLTISRQLKSALESSLFTQSLKLEKEDHFYFRQILFDHENLFVRILKK
jgi:riboflavin biosynthesis pyrimidine reductase